MLYAMEPADADWYTQAGFWLSVAGIVVSWVGLSATLWQVVKARRSADAARDAAELTRREGQASFRRYLAATVHRQLSEVESYVVTERWELASIRCEDVAAIFAQLAKPEIADEFRYFARVYRGKIVKPSQRVGLQRWVALMLNTKRQIDLLTAPF